MLDGFAEGTEDDALLFQRFRKGGLHGNGVHDGIHGHAGQHFLLFQRDAQFVEGVHQFGIHLVHAGKLFFLFGYGEICYVLIIRSFEVQVTPFGLFQGGPMAVCLKAELQQPFGFVLACGNHAHYVLIDAFGKLFHINIRHETVFIFVVGDVFQDILLFFFFFHENR